MPIGPVELLIILFILGGPILLGILFAIYLFTRSRSAKRDRPNHQTPLQMLQERYARGEIDSEEYEERRRRILNDQS
jgi:putative membrane protein